MIVEGGLSLDVSDCAGEAAASVGLLLAIGLDFVEVDTDEGGAAALGDGLESGLGSELELELESWAFATLLFSPVSNTDQLLSPPPTGALALRSFETASIRTLVVRIAVAVGAAIRVGGLAACWW